MPRLNKTGSESANVNAPATPATVPDANVIPATESELAPATANQGESNMESATPATPATTPESDAPATATATVKADQIKIANAQFVANQLGVKIPAVRALVHKGKLLTQSIDMPDFGIFNQTVVTQASIDAYKIAQAASGNGGAKRGGGKSRSTVNYKMSIPREKIADVVALLESQFGIVAVIASAPRKAKTTPATATVDATDTTPADVAPVA